MLEQHGSSRSTRSSRLARQNDWLDKVERVESSQVEFGLMTVFWRGIFREEFPRPHRWLLHLPTRCSGTCCWKCVHSSAIQCGFWFSHILVSSADWDYRTSIVVNFDLCSAWCWSILAVFFKIKKSRYCWRLLLCCIIGVDFLPNLVGYAIPLLSLPPLSLLSSPSPLLKPARGFVRAL